MYPKPQKFCKSPPQLCTKSLRDTEFTEQGTNSLIPRGSISKTVNTQFCVLYRVIRLCGGENRLKAEAGMVPFLKGKESEAGNRVDFSSLGKNRCVFETTKLITQAALRLRRRGLEADVLGVNAVRFSEYSRDFS